MIVHNMDMWLNVKDTFNTYYNRMIVHNVDMWLNVKDIF